MQAKYTTGQPSITSRHFIERHSGICSQSMSPIPVELFHRLNLLACHCPSAFCGIGLID
jgi:hypothetical protein